jgi:hypothetical protein
VLVPNRPMRFSIARWISSASLGDISFVLASFAGFLLLIAGLGALGFGLGFNIGLLGEDYNWIDMLQRGPGAQAARLLWALDHRNPLSPWWYIAVRDFILRFDAALLVLRYAMAAVLAFSSYILVMVVAGPRARPFALALAVLILFWMANRYTEQIIWNFQGALAASILSVAAYARFIAQERRSYHLYAVSLLLWFFAFATYTIQCGAAIAIGYLALRQAFSPTRDSVLDARPSLVRRLGRAVLDVVPYVVLLGLFLLIWQTTMGALADAIPLKFSAAALFRSLKQGVWNNDFAIFYDRVRSVTNPWVLIAAAVMSASVLFWALRWRQRGAVQTVPGLQWGTLVDVLIVFASLALPTILLESSSETWEPGTRWPMIYQVTTPAVWLVIIAALVLSLSRTRQGWASPLWNGAIALTAGIGALFSLADNWVQNAIISNETFIHENMQRLVAEDLAAGRAAPKQVLLRLEGPSRLWWRSFDIVSPVIARVWLRPLDTSFRLIPWYHLDAYAWWRIRFGPDSEGVSNAKVWGGTVPYQNIDILSVSGRTARRLAQFDQTDLVGFDVEWAREQPVSLPGASDKALCPLVWAADHPALLDGWSEPERDDKGPMRWTISRAAHLSLPARCSGRLLLRVVAAYAVSNRNIDRLQLSVNGQPLSYHRTSDGGNIVYEAELDSQALSASPLPKLQLGVDQLDTVPGDNREFGIAIRRVEVLPVARANGN